MKPAFWFIPLILLALGRQFARRTRPFTEGELLAWAPDLGAPKTVRTACQALQRSGLLERAPDVAPKGKRRPTNPHTWRLTADGFEACRTAVQEAGTQSRVAALKASNKARVSSTLYGRLWNLLRNRRQLTAEEAVTTLADAGEDTTSLQSSVARYLRGWKVALPGHIQVSARRVNGFKRFVVVKDLPPTPPPAKPDASTTPAARPAPATPVSSVSQEASAQ